MHHTLPAGEETSTKKKKDLVGARMPVLSTDLLDCSISERNRLVRTRARQVSF